ncbi:antitoxin [Bifidobacterium canis]|uniref:Antitoxin n=1 Tax=Bifidobacterium canis TaxID=2610880 RepID=A0A7K1J650_9BIFI|nr:antitoxin [Bifidobacterium canis]MUH60143.1 antitoxin [Bifidobacterium canis]
MKRYAVEWMIFALVVIALGGGMLALPETQTVWLWVLWVLIGLWVAAFLYVERLFSNGFKIVSVVVYALAWLFLAVRCGLFTLGSMPQAAAVSLSDLLLASVLILVSVGWVKDPRVGKE